MEVVHEKLLTQQIEATEELVVATEALASLLRDLHDDNAAQADALDRIAHALEEWFRYQRERNL